MTLNVGNNVNILQTSTDTTLDATELLNAMKDDKAKAFVWKTFRTNIEWSVDETQKKALQQVCYNVLSTISGDNKTAILNTDLAGSVSLSELQQAYIWIYALYDILVDGTGYLDDIQKKYITTDGLTNPEIVEVSTVVESDITQAVSNNVSESLVVAGATTSSTSSTSDNNWTSNVATTTTSITNNPSVVQNDTNLSWTSDDINSTNVLQIKTDEDLENILNSKYPDLAEADILALATALKDKDISWIEFWYIGSDPSNSFKMQALINENGDIMILPDILKDDFLTDINNNNNNNNNNRTPVWTPFDFKWINFVFDQNSGEILPHYKAYKDISINLDNIDKVATQVATQVATTFSNLNNITRSVEVDTDTDTLFYSYKANDGSFDIHVDGAWNVLDWSIFQNGDMVYTLESGTLVEDQGKTLENLTKVDLAEGITLGGDAFDVKLGDAEHIDGNYQRILYVASPDNDSSYVELGPVVFDADLDGKFTSTFDAKLPNGLGLTVSLDNKVLSVEYSVTDLQEKCKTALNDYSLSSWNDWNMKMDLDAITGPDVWWNFLLPITENLNYATNPAIICKIPVQTKIDNNNNNNELTIESFGNPDPASTDDWWDEMKSIYKKLISKEGKIQFEISESNNILTIDGEKIINKRPLQTKWLPTDTEIISEKEGDVTKVKLKKSDGTIVDLVEQSDKYLWNEVWTTNGKENIIEMMKWFSEYQAILGKQDYAHILIDVNNRYTDYTSVNGTMTNSDRALLSSNENIVEVDGVYYNFKIRRTWLLKFTKNEEYTQVMKGIEETMRAKFTKAIEIKTYKETASKSLEIRQQEIDNIKMLSPNYLMKNENFLVDITEWGIETFNGQSDQTNIDAMIAKGETADIGFAVPIKTNDGKTLYVIMKDKNTIISVQTKEKKDDIHIQTKSINANNYKLTINGQEMNLTINQDGDLVFQDLTNRGG